ncbi:MAG: Na+/H+ antiporter subunit G [Pseudomonadota bacterium]
MSAAMVDYLIELLASVMIVAGALFTLVGSIGLLRLGDVFQRMHAPTKATTLGVGLVLLASVLSTWTAQHELSVHEILVWLLLFVTAPVSAYMVAQVALRQFQEPAVPTQTHRSEATPGRGQDPDPDRS